MLHVGTFCDVNVLAARPWHVALGSRTLALAAHTQARNFNEMVVSWEAGEFNDCGLTSPTTSLTSTPTTSLTSTATSTTMTTTPIVTTSSTTTSTNTSTSTTTSTNTSTSTSSSTTRATPAPTLPAVVTPEANGTNATRLVNLTTAAVQFAGAPSTTKGGRPQADGDAGGSDVAAAASSSSSGLGLLFIIAIAVGGVACIGIVGLAAYLRRRSSVKHTDAPVPTGATNANASKQLGPGESSFVGTMPQPQRPWYLDKSRRPSTGRQDPGPWVPQGEEQRKASVSSKTGSAELGTETSLQPKGLGALGTETDLEPKGPAAAEGYLDLGGGPNGSVDTDVWSTRTVWERPQAGVPVLASAHTANLRAREADETSKVTALELEIMYENDRVMMKKHDNPVFAVKSPYASQAATQKTSTFSNGL